MALVWSCHAARHGCGTTHLARHGTFWCVACLGLPCCMARPNKGHSTFARYFTNRSHGEMKSDHQVDWLTSTLGSSRMSLPLSLTHSHVHISLFLSPHISLLHMHKNNVKCRGLDSPELPIAFKMHAITLQVFSIICSIESKGHLLVR